jgi:hypothetical protein
VRAIRSLAILTVAKFVVLIGLVFAGIRLFVMPPTGAAPLPAGEFDFGAATLLLIYAYTGFESAVVPAGEARDPARDMPRALLLALGLVALLYLAIQLVATAAVPDLATSTTPLLDAAAVLLGPVGAIILMLGVLASVGGNLLGAIFSVTADFVCTGARWVAAQVVCRRASEVPHSGEFHCHVRRRVVPAGGLGDVHFPGGDGHPVATSDVHPGLCGGASPACPSVATGRFRPAGRSAGADSRYCRQHFAADRGEARIAAGDGGVRAGR